MQTRQEKKESGQIAKIDNKDLLGFASKNPKESILRKPDWIRVKAPTSQGYQETKAILNQKNYTLFAKRHLAPISENAGSKNMPQ